MLSILLTASRWWCPPQVFSELAKIGPLASTELEEEALRMPFHPVEPHPGLRSYPFLPQVQSALHPALLAPAPGGLLCMREKHVDVIF